MNTKKRPQSGKISFWAVADNAVQGGWAQTIRFILILALVGALVLSALILIGANPELVFAPRVRIVPLLTGLLAHL